MRVALCLLSIATLCLLIGCGTPGAPQPPSLGLPRPVDDLSAVRKGDKVFLSWTPAHQTTDHENIRHPGGTQVCRGVRDFPMISCEEKAGEKNTQLSHWTRGEQIPRATFTDTLPAQLEHQNPDAFAIYAIEDLNAHNKSAGLSNQVEIPLAPTLPPPDQVEPQVTAEGPELRWTAPEMPPQSDKLKFSYRVYRQFAPGSAPATAPALQRGELIVGEFPWNGEKQISFRRSQLRMAAEVCLSRDHSHSVQGTARTIGPGGGQRFSRRLSWMFATSSRLRFLPVFRRYRPEWDRNPSLT